MLAALAYNSLWKMLRSEDPPNLDFGSPVIFFDTHPLEQESYLYSYYTSLKTQLTTAWTGVPPKSLLHGKLRIVWWTVSFPVMCKP